NILARPSEEVMRGAVIKALGLDASRIGTVIHDALDAGNRRGEPDHGARLSAARLASDILGLQARNVSAKAPVRVELTMPEWLRAIRRDGTAPLLPHHAPRRTAEESAGASEASA